MCVGCVPQADVLYTDLDKFKVSVSICYGSVTSQSSSSLCVFRRAHFVCLHVWTNVSTSVCVCVCVCVELLMLALETIIAEIICFQGRGTTIKG